jgi:hypothetical protein
VSNILSYAFPGSLVLVCYESIVDGKLDTQQANVRAETPIHLQFLLKPLNKLSQSPTAVRNLVLFNLWHLRISLALVLEASVPTWITKKKVNKSAFCLIKNECTKKLTEVSRSTSLHDRTLKPAKDQQLYQNPTQKSSKTYSCPPLENDRLMAGTFAVSESADCLGGLILETCEQLVELRDAEGLEEPFSARLRVSERAQREKKRRWPGLVDR